MREIWIEHTDDGEKDHDNRAIRDLSGWWAVVDSEAGGIVGYFDSLENANRFRCVLMGKD